MEKVFIFYLFFVDVPYCHGAPDILPWSWTLPLDLDVEMRRIVRILIYEAQELTVAVAASQTFLLEAWYRQIMTLFSAFKAGFCHKNYLL